MRIDILPRHTGNARRLRHIALGGLHEMAKILTLKAYPRFAIGYGLCRQDRSRQFIAGNSQIRSGDGAATIDDNGAFDGVFEFAHIARPVSVSYTHLRAHETDSYLVC